MDLVPEAAALASLQDLSGAGLELRSLWSERAAVIAWLRHFG